MRVNALVLAGAPNEGKLKECSAAPFEALVPIKGRPMIRYVVDALRGSKAVEQVVVVGPVAELTPVVEGDGLRLVAPVGNIIDNALEGIRALPRDKKVLVATADIPLITAGMIDGFLDLCSRRDADFYYPIIERRLAEERFPNVKRTYVPIREGVFTGGNVVLLEPDAALRSADRARRFIDYRKSPLKMASILGWGFLFRLVTKSLSVPDLEVKISRLFDLRGVAVFCPYPEIGVDVDKPSDLELAEAVMATAQPARAS
ncbi:MAG: nucleotidyltransferase family protein [Acetobacteraceae bacterium]|nr:nucleotidyltransferase family protein [Acetobacteraceae bacterium]